MNFQNCPVEPPTGLFGLNFVYLKQIKNTVIMATVILDTRYSEAKKLLQKLKNERYAKVIEEQPNSETLKAMEQVEKGKAFKAKSATDLFESI